ncbi:Stamen-specific protein, partial [Actinidia chinensis var. chinensis]
MAATKSIVSLCTRAMLAFVLITLVVQTQVAQLRAQTCSDELGNLNMCAPFVVPGAGSTSPGSDCCSALQAVDHNCFCSTLRIAAQIPSKCNLPPLSCG